MSQWQAPENGDVYASLDAAYSEAARHYHTGEHIDDCLTQLDIVVDLAAAPEEIELALWFHDAVYRPTSSRNEEKSAVWAQRFLHSFGADESKCRRVCEHILATRHGADSLTGDTAIVVDIDLSILGRGASELTARMTNLLFVSSQNRLRSPTAEAVFSAFSGIDAIGAGTNADAATVLSRDLIDRADIVFVMENSHRNKISRKFREVLKGKRLIVLGIPDDYRHRREK